MMMKCLLLSTLLTAMLVPRLAARRVAEETQQRSLSRAVFLRGGERSLARKKKAKKKRAKKKRGQGTVANQAVPLVNHTTAAGPPSVVAPTQTPTSRPSDVRTTDTGINSTTTPAAVKAEDSSAVGSIVGNTFTSAPWMPLPSTIRTFSAAVLGGYQDCDAFENDLVNAASFQASQTIHQNAQYEWSNSNGTNDYPVMMTDSVAVPENTVSNKVSDTTNQETSFGTNNQVEGVDEADIVKSDGKTVFAAYGDTIRAWDAITGVELSSTKIALPKSMDSSSNIPQNKGLTTTTAPETSSFAIDETAVAEAPEAADVAEKMSILPPIPMSPTLQVRSLLLYEDRLVAIVEIFNNIGWTEGDSENLDILRSYGSTQAHVFDISNVPSDGSQLTKLDSTDFLGYYQEARSIGQYAHIVTVTDVDTYSHLSRKLDRWNYPNSTSKEYTAQATADAEGLVRKFANKLMNELADGGSCQNIVQLAMFQSTDGDETTVPIDAWLSGIINGLASINSFDMKPNELEVANTRVFLPNSWGNIIYASEDYLYLANQGSHINENGTWTEETFFMAFTLEGQRAQGHSVGKGLGVVLNQFSIDEHNGYVRVASTSNAQWGCAPTKATACEWQQLTDTDNRIIVFKLPTDGSGTMSQVGLLDGLGKPGETIHSVRFMKNNAFMVTFERTDPFYTIDLNDPTRPFIVGTLEVPGYSSQLHPFDAAGNLMIAIGQDANEQGVVSGLQVSLFDVTVLADPQLLQRYNVEQDPQAYSSSGAEFDNKAFRWLAGTKNLILPVQWYSYNNSGSDDSFDGFMVLNVDTSGINLDFEISQVDPLDMRYGCWSNAYLSPRSLVFNGVLTTIKGHTVAAHDLNTHKKEFSLNLDANLDKIDCVPYWYY